MTWKVKALAVAVYLALMMLAIAAGLKLAH